MHTRYRITGHDGTPLGAVFTIEDLKAAVAANPGATYKASAVIDDPCASHPSFERDNCPSCGTADRL